VKWKWQQFGFWQPNRRAAGEWWMIIDRTGNGHGLTRYGFAFGLKGFTFAENYD
jgi:hypothetical protein